MSTLSAIVFGVKTDCNSINAKMLDKNQWWKSYTYFCYKIGGKCGSL